MLAFSFKPTQIYNCNEISNSAPQIHQPLHLQEDNLPNVDKPECIHIPSIQERAETLVARFKGKPDRKDKPQVEQFKRKQHAFN